MTVQTTACVSGLAGARVGGRAQAQVDDLAETPAVAGVCMVTGAYPPDISGGDRQCWTLVQALAGAPPCLVLTTTTERALPRLTQTATGTIVRCPVDPRSGWSKLRAALRMSWSVWRRRRDFSVMQLHGASQKHWLLVAWAKLLGKRIVWKMTSAGQDDPQALRRGRWGWLTLRLLLQADAIVSINQAFRQRYLALGLPAMKLVDIPNGVDTQRFSPSPAAEMADHRRALGLPADAPLVVSVGFFSAD